MSRHAALRAEKVLLALLGFAAVVTEIAVLTERGSFSPANFFSYFTIEGNLIAVGVLLWAAVTGSPRSRRLEFFRGAATLYVLTIFVVFSLLLSGQDPSILTAVPWDNTVLHYLMPIGVAIDWVLDPPRRRIPFRTGLWWLVLPLGYLAYSLIRGAAVGWYPYPFLDPSDGGYGEVAVVGVAIAVVVALFAWGVTRVPRRSR